MKNDNLIYNKYKTKLNLLGWPTWKDGDISVHLVCGVCGWVIDRVEPPYDDDAKFDASEFHDHIDDYMAEAIIQKWIL